MARRRSGGRRRSNRIVRDEPKHRINDFIRVPEVRLVGDNLDEVSDAAGRTVESGVYDTRQVKKWARELGSDLVEISAKAQPPVVRIMDYSKFIYDQKKKEKEIKAKAVKTVLKEIRFGPNTDDHDFDFKLRHAKAFLEEGAKLKAYVHFKGRSIVFKDRGELLLLRFIKELEELGMPEELPRMEGRRMHVIIAPDKKKLADRAKEKARAEAAAKKAAEDDGEKPAGAPASEASATEAQSSEAQPSEGSKTIADHTEAIADEPLATEKA